MERRGRSLLPLCEPDDPAVARADRGARRVASITGRLAVERFDGASVMGSDAEQRGCSRPASGPVRAG